MSENWRIGPFDCGPPGGLRQSTRGPLHLPRRRCRRNWAAKDAFNPGAGDHEGQSHMLFHGRSGRPLRRHFPDRSGRQRGRADVRSRASACAVSGRRPWQPWESPGGCEDPRVVESPDGGYVATYTAFDGKVADSSWRRRMTSTLEEAWAGLWVDALWAALVEEWLNRDGGQSWPPRDGTHRRPVLNGTRAKERASPLRPRTSSAGRRSISTPLSPPLHHL